MLSILAAIPSPPDNTPVLRALEYVVILLLWLFFMWVVRAVWVEVRPLRRRRRGAGTDEAAPAATNSSRQRRKQLRLHLIRPEEYAGLVYETGDEVTVGRAAGCGIPIDYDAYASNLHARLFRLDGDLWVEDLGSTNGTWVNAQRIGERTRVVKGDLVQVGGTVFEVGR